MFNYKIIIVHIVCTNHNVNRTSMFDLSDLAISGMGFQKKFGWARGEWVGWYF